MLNRHLFRGKRLDNGEWIQGNLVENWQFGNKFIPAVIRPRQIEFHQDYTQKTYAIAVDPNTVGQCTGDEDENGVLIFEGDIVKPAERFSEDKTYEVLFSDESLRFGLYIVPYGMHSDFSEYAGGDLVIIGNRFDHPGLLEV